LNEDPDHDERSRLPIQLGIVFSFLFALTWSLPGGFGWILFSAAAYCFFLYWYHLPRKVAAAPDEPFEYRTSQERASAIVKKVVRIVWISALSLFLFFLVIGIFTDKKTDQDGQSVEQDDQSAETADAFQTDEAQAWNQKGYEFYVNKDYDSALYYYDRVLRLESNNAGAWYSKGLVYYDQKQMDKALDSFSRAYSAGMRDAFLSHVLGYLYDENGNTSRAITFYKEAVGMDSTRTDIYARLAEIEPSAATRYKTLGKRWESTR
jgi:tetratricopeptide (TPR) repeat protein